MGNIVRFSALWKMVNYAGGDEMLSLDIGNEKLVKVFMSHSPAFDTHTRCSQISGTTFYSIGSVFTALFSSFTFVFSGFAPYSLLFLRRAQI